MKWNTLLIGLSLLLTVACGSKKDTDRELEDQENEDIAREYKVIDASSNMRPGWIEDAIVWSKQNSKDTKNFRFYSYETEPKGDRKISCKLAIANAKTEIAGEIASFIDETLASSTMGDASIDENNPVVKELREYVETTLSSKIMAIIHGASLEKKYWEKRKYLKKLGAKADFIAYTCAAYMKISKERLNRAIDEAANHVVNQVDDPEAKDNVRKALKDLNSNFNKAKSGQI